MKPTVTKERCATPSEGVAPVKLLIVTGGHPYEATEFFAVFNAMPNVRYDHVLLMDGKPAAVPLGGLRHYDAVLFYDMETSAITQEWRELLDRGRGLVFLHHAVASFPDSPEYMSIVGGQGHFFAQPPGGTQSTYHMGERQKFSIADRSHPVTCGLQDFEMVDEAYDDLEISPAVHVLVTSDYPRHSSAVVWTWSYDGKRVLYIQPGHGSFLLPPDHGPTAYQNSSFKQLLNRGILWVAGRL